MGSDSCYWACVSCTLADIDVCRGFGVGEFFRVASDVHRRLSDFIHAVVVHRTGWELLGFGGVGFGRIPWCIPIEWLRPDLVPPCTLFYSVSHISRLVVLGCLLLLLSIDEEFRKAWLPYFCRSGQRDTSLEEFSREVEEWLASFDA